MTLVLLAFFIFALGAWLLWLARRDQQRLGLPQGHLSLADMPGLRQGTTLHDPYLGLRGRPDYVIALDEHTWVPVEVKSGRTPATPYEGHVYQVVAYALLLQRVLRKRVPFALLHYPETTFRIEVTPQREAEVLALLARMQHYRRTGQEPGRSHNVPARCASCGFQHLCNYRLHTHEGER